MEKMTESNKKLVVNLTAPDHDYEEGVSRNRAVAKVISKPSGPGLLDLPPEIRLMIFRHLLIRPRSLPDWDYSLPSGKRFLNLAILRTSKLIHKEAFDVFYKENWFDRWFWHPPFPITRSPRAVDSVQNIETFIWFDSWHFRITSPHADMRVFVKLMQLFGNHSIIRRNLLLVLYVGWLAGPRPLKWLVGALGRFTNFKKIELYLRDFEGFDNNFSECCEQLQTALEPVLGKAEEFAVKDGAPRAINLRFHPVDHQNQSRKPDDGDCDHLDGIRLGWNETLTHASDSGRPTQE